MAKVFMNPCVKRLDISILFRYSFYNIGRWRERTNGFLKIFRTFFCIAILFLIIFSGCATKEAVKDVSDEDVLRARVIKYWEHKIKKEFDKSYDFEYPLYKKVVPMVKYIQRFSSTVRWLDASILDMKVEGENAGVDLTVKTRLILPQVRGKAGGMYSSHRKEKWIKADGVWYHVPKKFLKGITPSD